MADIEKINELVGNKEFKEALELAATALVDEPDNIELIKLAGLAEVNIEDWDKAKYHFETVIKYSPDDATSWFYLANCYNNLGDFVSAKNAYLKVIELRKEYVDLLIGRILLDVRALIVRDETRNDALSDYVKLRRMKCANASGCGSVHCSPSHCETKSTSF